MHTFDSSLRLITCALVFSLAACGDDGTTTAPCTVPSAEACTCERGFSGVRMCLPTMVWGACQCEGVDSSLPPRDTSIPDATTDAAMDAPADTAIPDAGVTWPATPDDYTAAMASRIETLTIPIPDSSGAVDCCRDWGAISRDNVESGTDDLDNAFAALAEATAGLGLDLQMVLDSTLASGELSVLLDHQGFDGDPDPAFVIAALDGVPDGAAGYMIDRNTFIPGMGVPRSLFEPASLASGALDAGPGRLTLALPFAGITLAYTFEDVLIEGTVTVGSGVTYTSGTLSGYLSVDDYFGGINDFVGTSCGCLGLSGPLYSRSGAGSSWMNQCLDQAVVDARCTAPAEAPCREVAAGTDCTASPLVIPSVADLDTDPSTPGYESLSLGLRFTASPVTVTGVTP